MNKFFIHLKWIKQFLRFYLKAKTIYQIDSPFVHRFAKEVIEDRRIFYAFPMIEEFRKELKDNETPIPYEDHGSPSMAMSEERTIGKTCKHTGISPRIGRYLFKIIHTYKPEIMLELGTGLGISTLYQAPAALGGDLFSIEASATLSKIAHNSISLHGLPNVEIIHARFEEAIPELSKELPQIDYVFIDGHHDQQARIQYFEWMKDKFHSESVLVFSDIYRSEGMIAAWNHIQSSPSVSLSIDLFDIGVAFFNPSIKEKQAFKLVPSRWKWWKMGLFR